MPTKTKEIGFILKYNLGLIDQDHSITVHYKGQKG